MRKLKFFILTAILCVCLAFGAPVSRAEAAEREYYVGGMAAGFMLGAGGVQIVGVSDVVAEDGSHRPAEEVGLTAGDLIRKINGLDIDGCEQLNRILEKGKGKELTLTVERKKQQLEVKITPIREKKSGKYRLGVLIRDTVSGIGTVTYIDSSTLRFGALGHAVSDGASDKGLVSDSRVYLCSVIGVNKGARGKAGELRGLFLNDRTIARAECVNEVGLYGKFVKGYDFSSLERLPAGNLTEASIGMAEIYSTIDGVSPKKYEIAICKVDADNKEHKNFVIKVTDEELIAETGGIVQGMSGSPIIQNGKLIGAITHVFLNDPTRGYGIGIEYMLGN